MIADFPELMKNWGMRNYLHMICPEMQWRIRPPDIEFWVVKSVHTRKVTLDWYANFGNQSELIEAINDAAKKLWDDEQWPHCPECKKEVAIEDQVCKPCAIHNFQNDDMSQVLVRVMMEDGYGRF